MFKITKKTGEEKIKWGWTMYDWANNVYSLIITTAIFPIYYISQTTSTDAEGNTSDVVEFFGIEFINTQLYSYILAASFLFVIILSPLLSGMADFTGKKKLFMRIFTYSGAAGCFMLYWFDPEHIELSLLPFFIASLDSGVVSDSTTPFPEIALETSTIG